eukprot:2097838-Lingulodinium_polyedra.AAC.1
MACSMSLFLPGMLAAVLKSLLHHRGGYPRCTALVRPSRPPPAPTAAPQPPDLSWDAPARPNF